jgi:3-oxoacid CoA-transferase subunit A
VDKVSHDAAAIVSAIHDGASLAVGGFGVTGVPSVLLDALLERGISDLTAISNNCGAENFGLGLLLKAGRLRRMIASYIGENREFARQYVSGELEVELMPQGTLAERLRAAGMGIPAFYTPTGVGTLVADGGLPIRYDGHGDVALASEAKEVREFGATRCVLETALPADFGLVRAWQADTHGNAVFRMSAQNFNTVAGMAGRVTIVEAEHVVPAGQIDPAHVHLPGIFVHHVLALTPEQAANKPIEHRTVRAGATADPRAGG